MAGEHVVPSGSDVYYGSGYWNEITQVLHELQRRASGNPDVPWYIHLRDRRGVPFERALSLNCGNGWVERDLVRWGVTKTAVGMDFAEDLLARAREAAAEAGHDITYLQADTNKFEFDAHTDGVAGVDLVINHAAGHHIAYLDRVFRRICRLLPDDGLFVSWDYVGPHRNQYPTHQWEAIWALNQRLPEALRKDLRYPHMRSMLQGDPTEAVHSDLILPVMRRYFDIEHVSWIGGALAYEILCFNPPFYDGSDRSEAIRTILDADLAYLGDDPEANTLFAYVIARPRKAALDDIDQLARWTEEEDAREAAAAAAGGRYGPPTMLEQLYDTQYALENAVATGKPPAIDGRPAVPLWRFWASRWKRRALGLARRGRAAGRSVVARLRAIRTAPRENQS